MSDVVELKADFNAQLIVDLKKENERLKQQIVELSIAKQISEEELICIRQISILHDRSQQRELSLEEIKKLDLLVKNLKLITGNVDDKKLIRDIGNIQEDVLVAIATSAD